MDSPTLERLQMVNQGNGKIKVMLVDDQEVFRQLAREMLEEAGDFQVVAEAADGTEAVEKVGQVHPDLVLMDIQMPKMNGLEATKAILQRHPDIQVVLISMYQETEFLRLGHRLGALAFIAKKALTVEGLRAILQAAA